MSASPAVLKQTHLRRYYDALEALQEAEQTHLAELHAADPTPLVHRFRESIRTLDQYPDPGAERFHEGGRKDPAQPPVPVRSITTTIDFASHLADHAPRAVLDAEELAFRYVDREVFLLRTTDPTRVASRKLDLLLVNDKDGMPVLGELKIRGDRLPYFALVQLLMYATEAVSSLQRQRLRSVYSEADPSADFRWPEEGPFADLYLISFEPKQGTYFERSLKATKRISEGLVAAPFVDRHVRRIVYLEAVPTGDELVFERRFSFKS